MAADIFAKHFIEAKWICACRLLDILPPRHWKGLADAANRSPGRPGTAVIGET